MMKERSKYYPLYQFLQQCEEDLVTLSLDQVRAVIDAPLPPSALSQRAWWSNRRLTNAQSAAWLEAGYRVDEIDLTAGRIVFRKQGKVPNYEVKRQGSIVMWDGAMVKALREHMGLNQTEFARELGVRQPTVSEWETAVYQPRRSSSRLLMIIAERAGFRYE